MRRSAIIPSGRGQIWHAESAAGLDIRFAEVELRAPKLKRSLGALRLWAVYVTEVGPASEKEAVEWMLLTTLEVNHLEQALLAFKRPDQPLPSTPSSVRKITRRAAELGGFPGRKSDAEPGSTTLGRGLQRLHNIASALLIFKQHHSVQQRTA